MRWYKNKKFCSCKWNKLFTSLRYSRSEILKFIWYFTRLIVSLRLRL